MNTGLALAWLEVIYAAVMLLWFAVDKPYSITIHQPFYVVCAIAAFGATLVLAIATIL